ncbi:hypothetical protein RvY_03865 [Ramazzottius varieornatus]|uniref:Uncharacterized protein n=1 Tax=Ramazzottius varieornatus TaxID=947166 RepID=A0A1D1UPJ4_RAMVA|nr:hypothetical protein RvY_03865 [Ramazzottius varieornatus]
MKVFAVLQKDIDVEEMSELCTGHRSARLPRTEETFVQVGGSYIRTT